MPLRTPNDRAVLRNSGARPADYDSILEDWWNDEGDERSFPPAKNRQVVIEDTEDDEEGETT